MDADLKALEEKLAKLIAQLKLLRTENVSLRQDLANLKGNMMLASTRLEALMERLPHEDAVEESELKESL